MQQQPSSLHSKHARRRLLMQPRQPRLLPLSTPTQLLLPLPPLLLLLLLLLPQPQPQPCPMLLLLVLLLMLLLPQLASLPPQTSKPPRAGRGGSGAALPNLRPARPYRPASTPRVTVWLALTTHHRCW
jgi:hypothetical protein